MSYKKTAYDCRKAKIYLVRIILNYKFYKSIIAYNMDDMNLKNLGYKVIMN